MERRLNLSKAGDRQADRRADRRGAVDLTTDLQQCLMQSEKEIRIQ